MMQQKLKYGISAFAAFSVLAFLYFPLVIIIWYSFNGEQTNSFPIHIYSLKWYNVLFQDDEMLGTVRASAIVALVATTAALAIGLPAAYGMHKSDFRGKKMLQRIVLMPITLPGIVTGVSMLSFFPLIGINLSLTAVTFGHITFLIAIIITQMLARFQRLDPFLEQAAFDLGATPVKAFFRVIFPNIRTAIIGAILLCLVLSFDEIPVTFFLIARQNTLPIEIYSRMRRGITPEVNAISTLIFIVTATAILLSMRFNKQQD